MKVDNREDKKTLKSKIIELKKEKNAVILGHYYQEGDIQDVSDFVGDSLALAQIASKIENPIIVMCGVYFMGETVKILCPERKVLIPDVAAGCSLADSCTADDMREMRRLYPDHTFVSYVNTSAEVKALTDVVVTSSNAKKIIDSFDKEAKIFFGPDRNLGGYLNSITGRNMQLYNGACHVHDRFSLTKLVELKKQYPEAKVLAHPECRKTILILADVVGSTAALLNYAVNSENKQFIVATESGILHEMKQKCPDKEFITVPADDSSCGCNDCEFMKLNTLEKLYNCLLNETPEIKVDKQIAEDAVKPIIRMLELSR